MIYDCVIVGGGPAGAICSFILQKHKISCLILEKRQVIDEKICGGFLPDRCRNLISECGIDLSEIIPYGNRIDGYCEVRNQKEISYKYKKKRYGIGISRKVLDNFLLEQSRSMGTMVVYGEKVNGYTKKDNLYRVNGYQGKYLIWATGATPPLSVEAFVRHLVREKAKRQSMGISEIIKVSGCSLDNHKVHFWYMKESNDYFWAIPIAENEWNIGYWSQQDRKNLKKNFIDGRKKYLEDICNEVRTVRVPKGALLGNVDFSVCLIDRKMLCCGDVAGTNNILTGEGMAQAVVSARKTAERIIAETEAKK